MTAEAIGAIILDKKDNVATSMTTLSSGDIVLAGTEDCVVRVVLVQDIPFGHKLALKNIRKGGAIVKYGEVIGRTKTNIGKGEHAHVHNVEGLRGRGDKR
jgi:altronate dehydratase small subunit